MSDTVRQDKKTTKAEEQVLVESKSNSIAPWLPWVGLVFILAVYWFQQFIGSLLVYAVSVIPLLLHGSTYANNWVQNSVLAQFLYVLFAEAFAIAAIYVFLRVYKRSFGAIGFHRPRWRDPAYGLAALPFYLLTYIIAVGIISSLVHGFNVSEQQQVGFNNVHGIAQLTMTAISLVILPPIAEEIMVRGFLYTTLKKWLPKVAAAVVTSMLFASAHLPEGGAAGLLWIAAVDTFILSLYLLFLRERTKNLWASMTLHGLKNAIAYYSLFLAPLISVHFR